MGQEGGSFLSNEEMENTESRMLSDAELIKGGAKIKEDGRLEVTKSQVGTAEFDHKKEIMESLRGENYEDATEVFGRPMRVRWDEDYNEYTLYFDGISIGD